MISANAQNRAVSKALIHEQIVPLLRNDIISNRWEPGERLPEPALCEEFRISRTPLREAFKILEAESLVEIRRVLKSGGHFLCFHLPNQYSYVEAVSRLARRGAAPDPRHDAHHRFRFSVRQTLEL